MDDMAKTREATLLKRKSTIMHARSVAKLSPLLPRDSTDVQARGTIV